MGKSGMKRKGRSHLPKAGTRPANEQLLHHERAGALNPFSSSRRGGTSYGIVAVVVAVVAVIGVITLVIFT